MRRTSTVDVLLACGILELLGARLDRDLSVLIYPEGKLTVGGPKQSFKSGSLADRIGGR